MLSVPNRRGPLVRRVALVSLVFGSGLLGCGAGAGAVAKTVRPKDTTANSALGEDQDELCRDVSRGGRPLVVDWRPELRSDLEVAMSEGIAVVTYDCKKLELLADCKADGSYGFKGVVLKQQLIRLADSDEIKTNLPLSGAALAARLEADLERGTTLDLATALVGNLTSTRYKLEERELTGSCEGATHFVRAANVGAFAMQTGSSADVLTAAQLFGAGVHGGSTSSRLARQEDGSIEDCKRASADQKQPPANCRALIRLHLVPISTGAPSQTAQASSAPTPVEEAGDECPEGTVLTEGKCVAKEKAVVHTCEGEDVSGCTVQCDRGDPASCARLGRLYARGKGVPADRGKAEKLLQKACGAEQATACSDLAILITNSEQEPKDYRRLAGLFERACKLGDANGCFNLGTLYYDGMGVEKDAKRAFTLFEQACNAGKAAGCINVGNAYDDGDGVEKDPAKAFALFKRACEGDEALGCHNLAYMYSRGSGASADQALAARTYEKACELGSQKGCEQIGARYLSGNGVSRDDARGKALLKKACEMGSKSACATVDPSQ